MIHIFSDSDPVVDVLVHEKPKDAVMQELLREFLFILYCKYYTKLVHLLPMQLLMLFTLLKLL